VKRSDRQSDDSFTAADHLNSGDSRRSRYKGYDDLVPFRHRVVSARTPVWFPFLSSLGGSSCRERWLSRQKPKGP
jgi:hypothetical protein